MMEDTVTYVPERIDALDLKDKKVSKRWKVDHIYRYVLARKYCKGKVVLDAGCGTGYGTYILSKMGKYVITFDLANVFRKRYKTPNISFFLANAEKLPFREQVFDVIVCMEVIEHLGHPNLFLKGAYKSLKKDGLLIFSTPNKKYSYGVHAPYHINEFNVDELAKFVEQNGFKVLKLLGQSIADGWYRTPIRWLERTSPWFNLLNCKLGAFFPRYSVILILIAKKL